MTTHELKTWPEYFELVVSGQKTFEIRKNDRNYRPGDLLVLREYDPSTDRYSGDERRFRVGFVFKQGFGIDLSGYVVISLVPAYDHPAGCTCDWCVPTPEQSAEVPEMLRKPMTFPIEDEEVPF